MTLKIILSNLELNLVDNSFTMIEENNWFSSSVFSKYTYSISYDLTDAEDAALGFITNKNSVNYNTLFDCRFYVLDKEYDAVLEIIKVIGNTLEFQLRYGFEDFPNFDKKLAQLPLLNFELTNETIFEHAQTIIPQTYPAVKYNFPQVITSQFSAEEEKWEFFEGIINNYKNNAFLLNEYDLATNKQINRNIIQPLPYLLYLLETGFNDAGYSLEGDIFEDPELKQATLNTLNEFYTSASSDYNQEVIIKTDEYIELVDGFGKYEKFITITGAGRYKMSGNLYVRSEGDHGFFANVYIYFNGAIRGHWTVDYGERYIILDINVDILPGETDGVIRILSYQLPYQILGETTIDDATILDASIVQLTAFDQNGEPSPTLIFPEVINLSKAVPDITFGKLTEIVRLWKNYAITITGNRVIMNTINSQIGSGKHKDLTAFEIADPERTFNQGKKYILKFPDIESDDYSFVSLYITKTGVVQSPYVKADDVDEILIDAIPLPMKFKDGIVTADGFLQDNEKVQVILYNGLQNGLNLANDPNELLLPAVYEKSYREWIDFLLKAVLYKWEFTSYDEDVKDLTIRSTPVAYSQYHVVKSIQFKNLKDGIIKTEIETYSIE